MNSKIAAAVGLAAVLAAVLAPVSTLTPAFAASVAVDITAGSQSKTTDAYAPNPVNANVGDMVIWTNKDTQFHTVTSGSSGTADGKFDSGLSPPMGPQAKFNHTFGAAGDFPYYCALHPNMVGTVKVAAGGPTETKITASLDGKSYEITSKSTTSKPTEATIQSSQSVTVKFDKAGDVELTLPTDMISGINSVMAGDEKLSFTSTGSSTIKFTVPEGSTTVVIKGTSVVPEFPTIAAILVATIAAFIAYTRFARSRTGFFGRA
jgi:plastocyanin